MKPKFQLGDKVRKIKGSQWHGIIVGTYSTELTPEGYCHLQQVLLVRGTSLKYDQTNIP